MKKSQLRQLIREEIKKSYLNESLEALISKATKIQAFVDKQGKKDGYEGGVHSPVGGVLTALKVAGGPGFDGDEKLKGFYTRKLSKAIDTQLQKKYMSGFSVDESESVNEAEFKHISPQENKIKDAIKDVEKKARLKANRDKPLEYAQLSLNKIMLSKVLGREELGKEHQGAWEKLKKEYNLK